MLGGIAHVLRPDTVARALVIGSHELLAGRMPEEHRLPDDDRHAGDRAAAVLRTAGDRLRRQPVAQRVRLDRVQAGFRADDELRAIRAHHRDLVRCALLRVDGRDADRDRIVGIDRSVKVCRREVAVVVWHRHRNAVAIAETQAHVVQAHTGRIVRPVEGPEPPRRDGVEIGQGMVVDKHLDFVDIVDRDDVAPAPPPVIGQNAQDASLIVAVEAVPAIDAGGRTERQHHRRLAFGALVQADLRDLDVLTVLGTLHKEPVNLVCRFVDEAVIAHLAQIPASFAGSRVERDPVRAIPALQLEIGRRPFAAVADRRRSNPIGINDAVVAGTEIVIDIGRIGRELNAGRVVAVERVKQVADIDGRSGHHIRRRSRVAGHRVGDRAISARRERRALCVLIEIGTVAHDKLANCERGGAVPLNCPERVVGMRYPHDVVQLLVVNV